MVEPCRKDYRQQNNEAQSGCGYRIKQIQTLTNNRKQNASNQLQKLTKMNAKTKSIRVTEFQSVILCNGSNLFIKYYSDSMRDT